MSERQLLTGYAIPDETNVPWDEAKPKPIYHYVYKMRQTTNENRDRKKLPKNALVIFKDEQTPTRLADKLRRAADGGTSAGKLKEMEDYAAKVAKGDPNRPRRRSSSVHIDIEQQCWVLIELAKNINWRFSTTHPAVTTKKPEPDVVEGGKKVIGFNANLRYVFPGGAVVSDPSKGPKGENCRHVFFRVAKRRADMGDNYGMNFFVEFYQENTGDEPTEIIPIIIDPQVPEDPPSMP